MRDQKQDIPGPGGSTLKGLLRRPAGPVKGLMLICHCHPGQGGHMGGVVLADMDIGAYPEEALAVQAAKQGYMALRFNYRTTGTKLRITGRSELADAVAALKHLKSLEDGDLPLVIAGYSFGGGRATELAMLQDGGAIQGLLAIAPALSASIKKFPNCPSRMICGAGEVSRLKQLDQLCRASSDATVSSIPRAGHFFHRYARELNASIAQNLQSIINRKVVRLSAVAATTFSKSKRGAGAQKPPRRKAVSTGCGCTIS